MSLTLLATVLTALSGPAAVFWSGGRTWIVDADRGSLYFAAGWYASDGARVHRYRLRTRAERANPRARARRWTTLEHTVVGSRVPLRGDPVVSLRGHPRFWQPVTPVDPTALHDERVVLQFLGDRAVVARFVRTATGRSASATTWRLPDGGPLPPPAGAASALDWLERRLNVTSAVARGVVERELAGGRFARWLVTGDERGETIALALDRAQPFRPPRGAPDIVDFRPAPGGALALALVGDPLPGEEWRSKDLLSAHDPCDTRRLLLWRSDGAHTELGEVARLDGARWLSPDDPLRDLLATRFLPAGAPRCFSPLAVGKPGTPTAHRCRADEVDRVWGGPSDLAASAGLVLDEAAEVTVRVHDPERTVGDGVRLYFGSGRPSSVTVTSTGLSAHGRLRHRKTLRESVRAEWRAASDGYQVSVRVPLDLVGDPPAITIQVTDVDADGTVHLWAAGERVAVHQPRATEVDR